MSAVISECGTYRYWLERGEPSAPYVAWVLANPSTADGELDDPTVRKARGFTERWGFQRFVFVNIFAYRATKPKALRGVADPFGPENKDYIRLACADAVKVVVAWGGAVIDPHRGACGLTFTQIIRPSAYGPIECLGYTKDRQPRHPLMLAYSTPLEIYKP